MTAIYKSITFYPPKIGKQTTKSMIFVAKSYGAVVYQISEDNGVTFKPIKPGAILDFKTSTPQLVVKIIIEDTGNLATVPVHLIATDDVGVGTTVIFHDKEAQYSLSTLTKKDGHILVNVPVGIYDIFVNGKLMWKDYNPQTSNIRESYELVYDIKKHEIMNIFSATEFPYNNVSTVIYDGFCKQSKADTINSSVYLDSHGNIFDGKTDSYVKYWAIGLI